MPHHVLLNSLAAALIGVAAASSASAQDITITGQPERVIGRTVYGADVVEYTASVVVNVRDLDLASAAGWKAMEGRVTSASRAACNIIAQRSPFGSFSDYSDCARAAYYDAIGHVRGR